MTIRLPLSRAVLAAALLCAVPLAGWPPARANPAQANVLAGRADLQRTGNLLTIHTANGTLIEWGSFSIRAGEVTRFVQPGAGSSVLNRVVGGQPSEILGALQSNGQVFLINPNGVLFGAGSRVDVQGLVASSLDISNADFAAGRMRWQGSPDAGAVQAQGAITTPRGGRVFLLAPEVEQRGLIRSPEGEILLAAGHQVRLADSSDPNVQVVVKAPGQRAVNLGRVIAEGGRIGIYGALVEQRGTLNADSAVRGADGRIELKATRRTTLADGSVTRATQSAGSGGTVVLQGPLVVAEGDARVDASGSEGGGRILLGGGYHGQDPGVANAEQVFLGRDVRLRADATHSGDGGQVIVWSDVLTEAWGHLSARSAAGKGGLVEVSSGRQLSFAAQVSTQGGRGHGTLVLDPETLEIRGGSGDGFRSRMGPGDGPATFNGGNRAGEILADQGLSVVYQSELEGLGADNDIVLEASNLIRAAGQFDTPLTLGRDTNLTLRTRNQPAHGDAAGWTLGIDLTTSANGAGLEIRTQGSGSITLQTSGPGGWDAPIRVGSLSSEQGAISIRAKGDVEVLGSVRSQGGALALEAGGAAGRLSLLQGSSLSARGSAEGDTLDLRASRLWLEGSVTMAGQGQVRIRPAADEPGRGIVVAAAKRDDALVLTPQELDTIAAPSLVLQTAGDVTVSSATSLARIGALQLTGATLAVDAPLALPAADSRLGLRASGDVRQQADAPVDVARLAVVAAGDVSLDAANAVGLLAAAVGDAEHPNHRLAFRSVQALQVGSVDGVRGITLAHDGSAFDPAQPAGDASLVSAGALTQQAGAPIDAAALYAEGSRVQLTEANPTRVLAGRATGSGADDVFVFSASGDLRLGTVAGRSGIRQAGAAGALPSVWLQTGSAGTLGQDADAPVVTAGALRVDGGGAIDLGSAAANRVGAFAARTQGAVTLSTAGEVELGCDGVGVASGGGDIAITAGGRLTVGQAVDAGAGAVSLQAPSLQLGSTAAGGVSVAGGRITLVAGAAQGVIRSEGGPSRVGGEATEAVLLQADRLDFSAGRLRVAAAAAGGVVQWRGNTAGAALALDDRVQADWKADSVVFGEADSQLGAAGDLTIGVPVSVSGHLALLSGGTVRQSAPIGAADLLVVADGALLDADNRIGGVAARLRGGDFVLHNGSPLRVGEVAAGGLAASGIATAGGAVTIANRGALVIAAPVDAGSGTVAITTHSPLTVGAAVAAGGDIALVAGASGSSEDKLVITQEGSVVSRAGSVRLSAGDEIRIAMPDAVQAAGGVQQQAYQNLPTLQQCIAQPALPGCGSVLPGLQACIDRPATPGCAVVLPTLPACMQLPTLPGCTVVLPGLQACIANPAQPGCSVVLPTLAACIATPTTPGCSAVLPGLGTCIAAPGTPGCSVVLPSPATCAAVPSVPGCSVVLPPTKGTAGDGAPVADAVGSTVQLINGAGASAAPTAPSVTVPTTTSTGDGSVGKADKVDSTATKDKSSTTTTTTTTTKSDGVTKSEPAKKLYCN